MPRIELPSPTLRLGRAEARRFLLMHQHLWPPRSLISKAGILDFIRHVGCIQYDPVNLVRQNPELVLQARVTDYTPRCSPSCSTPTGGWWTVGTNRRQSIGSRTGRTLPTIASGAEQARRPVQPADGDRRGSYGRDP